MVVRERVGTGMLLAGGLALALLMGYTLTLDGRTGPAAAPRADEALVAVFFPGRGDWNDFRRGIRACARRGLARVVEEADGVVFVETPRRGRRVRFAWYGVGGLGATRAEAHRLAASDVPPVAVVGSSNTMLTVALAEALRDAGPDARGPVLLIPWATTVRALPPGGGRSPVALLDLAPGRTFRFCPDNQRVADLVVGGLAEHEPGAPPSRALVVVDRDDPYSRDLADCFRTAIGRLDAGVELLEQAGGPHPAPSAPPAGPGDNRPGEPERRWADGVWATARAGPAGRPTWVVLPLQDVPARRAIAALIEQAPPGPAPGPLRVVCGDGIDLESLDALAGHNPVPIWSASSESAPAPGERPRPESFRTEQIPAEVVAAVLLGLDRPGSHPDLRDALAGLDLGPDHPAAMGRSLAFGPSGERRGEDLGHVRAVLPGHPDVLAFARRPGDGWAEPVPIRPEPSSRTPGLQSSWRLD